MADAYGISPESELETLLEIYRTSDIESLWCLFNKAPKHTHCQKEALDKIISTTDSFDVALRAASQAQRLSSLLYEQAMVTACRLAKNTDIHRLWSQSFVNGKPLKDVVEKRLAAVSHKEKWNMYGRIKMYKDLSVIVLASIVDTSQDRSELLKVHNIAKGLSDRLLYRTIKAIVGA
ncbi:MAG: hypothetical protein MRY49_01185 [Candidatus Pacebacteria bacterium]|nr:hypothetical protein [Candidatus Paceibacterota bacterium]